jgi:hypothetical protein
VPCLCWCIGASTCCRAFLPQCHHAVGIVQSETCSCVVLVPCVCCAVCSLACATVSWSSGRQMVL